MTSAQDFDQRLQDFFVTTQWLAEHLGDPNVAILDGSWYLPAANRDPAAEYAAGHIPGALRFEIDVIADAKTHLPHMLPTEAEFSAAAGALGISEKQTIIVYDGVGLASAPRVWWTFRAFGAADVRILEGGMPKWKAEARPLETTTPAPPARGFAAKLDRARVRDYEGVRRHLADGDAQILDARPANRFAGKADEPRPGVRSGRMPGSHNLPSTDLIADGRLKSPEELGAAFAKAGIDLTKPLVTSCGSGVTAATLALAAATLGAKDVALYDGSWADWGSRPDAIVAKDD